VDGGFQKFFLTAGGKRKPALASDLKELHEFEEDLREALARSAVQRGARTVSILYLYDRWRIAIAVSARNLGNACSSKGELIQGHRSLTVALCSLDVSIFLI